MFADQVRGYDRSRGGVETSRFTGRRREAVMCEFVGGEVIFSFPDHPGVVDAMQSWFHHRGEEEHVRLVGRLDHRLDDAVPATARVRRAPQVWRVRVPPGQEVFKSNYLCQQYHSVLRDYGLAWDDRLTDLFNVAAEPNHILTLTSSATGAGPIRLTSWHHEYKQLVGIDGTETDHGAPRSVAVVDSGVAGVPAGRLLREVDLVTPGQFGRPHVGTTGDRLGHGTAVASIILDVAPSARLISQFSNTGTSDHLERSHPGVWFLPGGDSTPGNVEAVATGPNDKPFYGTSFACAYASALTAQLLAKHSRNDVLDRLAHTPGAAVEGYEAELHGHGRMWFPTLASPTQNG
ncbi:hypothetical protein [Streptomyces sp. CB03911]|uniref:hypothetical protein n=1 Tax=Streptomyces sp. CB03911 TaxID=1804758 RepID=UPI0018FE9BD0|nr:hypothetical protein [Streptomyces sp. CB03911]